MNTRVKPPLWRIGEGWDTHALVAGRKLVLGGVEIPHTHGLLGHSDARTRGIRVSSAVPSRRRSALSRFFDPADRNTSVSEILTWKGTPSRISMTRYAVQRWRSLMTSYSATQRDPSVCRSSIVARRPSPW